MLDAPIFDRAPAVLRVDVGTSSFLLVYSALTVCHAVGHDPRVVAELVPIPLFARVLASTVASAAFAVVAPRLVRDRHRALRLLPALLGASIVLALAVICWAA